MRRTQVTTGMLAWLGPALASIVMLGTPASAQSAKGLYARVEVRGQLLPGDTEESSNRPIPIIEADGLTFEVSFGGFSMTAEELRSAYHTIVVARGSLGKRTDAMGKDHLVLKLEGKLKVVGKVNYLIGYHEGEAAATEALCKELGLRIIENYQPGKYLKVEPTDQARHGFLDHLRKHPKSIRYVEANVQYRAQAGEDSSRPSIR